MSAAQSWRLAIIMHRIKRAQVFVQNPLNHRYDERIYRTGDLAKYDAQGNLVYISRKDFQIKHLGPELNLEKLRWQRMPWMESPDPAVFIETEKERLLLFYTGTCEKRQLIKTLRGVLRLI